MSNPDPAPRDEITAQPSPPALPSAVYLAAALFALRAVVDVVLSVTAGADTSGVASVIVDIALALALALGWERAVAIGILRVGVGWILGAGVALSTLPPLLARFVIVVELLGAIALLLTLVGTPARRRMTAAAVLFGAYAIVALSVTWALPILIEVGGTVTEIRGTTLDYRLSFPDTGWREVHPDANDDEYLPGDRWIARPDIDAVVVIRTELGASPATLSLDAFQRRVISELEGHSEQVAVVEQRELPRGRMAHVVWRDEAGDVHVLVGLFVVPGVAYRITGSVHGERFAEHEAELRTIIESFESGQ